MGFSCSDSVVDDANDYIKISTDIGSFPLVWIIPLSLYLITFIYAFSSRPFLSVMGQKLLVISAITVLFIFLVINGTHGNKWLSFSALLLSFFAIALVAHKRIHDTRPAETHLTLFYILISIGGVMGGLFNSVVATNLFDRVAEYPIIIAASGLLMITNSSDINLQNAKRNSLIAFLVVSLALYLTSFAIVVTQAKLIPWLAIWVLFSGAYMMRKNGSRSAIWIIGCTLIVSFLYQGSYIFRDRSFFGIHKVYNFEGLRVYSNGTTIHGAQLLEDSKGKPTPATYYHSSGPMGQVFSHPDFGNRKTIGVVGLGIGSLVCYRQPDQDWHLYEIDQAVDDIARNPALFNFMSDCGADVPTHIGDARLVIQNQKDIRFDVLVIDAFSSDAIPVHLVTTEAIELYLDRLNPDGILLLHISNRYFDLAKPLSAIGIAFGRSRKDSRS